MNRENIRDVLTENAALHGFEGEFSHICVIVRDIRDAVNRYRGFLDEPEPRVKQTCPPEIGKVRYNGKATDTVAWQTFFTLGGVRVELIEPDEHPSTWKDFLEKNGEGFHHISYVVKDLDGEVRRFAQAGMPVIQHGNYNGGRYVYIDTAPQVGMMLELMQND